MKLYNIGIYGVSGSGKSTMISKLINDQVVELKGSKYLKDRAINDFGIEFKYLHETQKNYLRKEFIEYANKFRRVNEGKIILVDGHLSFIEDNEIKTVITKDDIEYYDKIYYISPNAATVRARILNDDSRVRLISDVEIIRKWINFEIKSLRKICEDNDIQFYILSGDLDKDVEYFNETAYDDSHKITTKKIIEKLDVESETVFLVDGDATLSLKDTTIDFLKSADIDYFELKRIFKKYGYTKQGLYEVSKFYSSIDKRNYNLAVEDAANNAKLYPELLDALKEVSKFSKVILVTSGIKDIWQSIIDKYQLNFQVIAGNRLLDDYVVDMKLKGEIVTQLKDKGKKVISIGDSLMDKKMLENANEKIIVKNHRDNKYLLSEMCIDEHTYHVASDGLQLENLKFIKNEKLNEAIKGWV